MKTKYYTCLVQLLFLSAFPFLLSAQFVSPPFIDYDEHTHQFSLENEPTAQPQGLINYRYEPYWDYFWEFDDGHFSESRTPIHQYAEAGTYRVTVYLSPRYSISRPVSFSREIRVSGGRRELITYEALNNQYVNIEPNTSFSVVPGQEIQMAVSYGNSRNRSPISNGYLFFFFNREKEVNVSYKRIKVRESIRSQLDRQLLHAASIADEHLEGDSRTGVIREINRYEDALVFEVRNLGPAEQRNIFLTLDIDFRLLNKQDKDQELSVSAIFVPQSGDFRRYWNLTEQKLSILAVHDPNRIEVEEKRLYFHPAAPRELTYTIDFQNKARGTAKHVKIAIPLERGLTPLKSTVTTLHPELSTCPTESFDPDTISCYQWQNISGKLRDSVIVQLYNVGLEGTKSLGFLQSRRTTKGQVQVKIWSDATRTPLNRTHAEIYFDKTDRVKTNSAGTMWRRKSFFITPQFDLGLTGESFFHDPMGTVDRFGLGIAVLDAPLGAGISYGLEGSYRTLSFSRTSEPELDESQDFVQRYWEQTRLRVAEFNFLAGFQPNQYMRITSGLGISLPLFGRTELRDQAAPPESDNFQDQSTETREYGLFANQNQEVETPQSIGGYWRIGLEFGLLDRVTIGINQDYRYYPKIYYDACGHLLTYSVFARVRLLDGKFIN